MSIRRRFTGSPSNQSLMVESDYLAFVALEDDFKLKLSKGPIYYSFNETDWVELAAGTYTPTINKNSVIYIKGNLVPANYAGVGTFTIDKECNVCGNVMALLFGTGKNQYSLSGKNWAFYELFASCTKIKEISKNLLPATTLAERCYFYMFNRCTGLTSIPEELLPSTALANYCYCYMFIGCTGLTTLPERLLPATTLIKNCYCGMFYECVSLITLPENLLPATTLADSCYESMFEGCTGLISIPENLLPAITVTSYCYAFMFSECTRLTSIPENLLHATTLGPVCYNSMFKGCTGLTDIPEGLLPATTVTGSCYASMFSECTRLTNIPERLLQATTLDSSCYFYMFQKCTGITSIPEGLLPATTLASNCYAFMFSECTRLTDIPEGLLPATTVTGSDCYASMFHGCTGITSIPEGLLPATTLASYCYKSMFENCTKLTNIPENLLHATTLGDFCYDSMFKGCTGLTTLPENLLPATTLARGCYRNMFVSCTELTNVPKGLLPATTLTDYCYLSMFLGNSSLTKAPTLPATVLTSNCYYLMFYGCNLTSLKAYFMEKANQSTYGWVDSTTTGVFTKNYLLNESDIYTFLEIPTSWEIQDNVEITEYISLSITADDVDGRSTTTNIYYTLTFDGIDENGNLLEGLVKTGQVVSEAFPKNTSYTDTIEREISLTIEGLTATTTITQGVWVDKSYSVDLNNNWQLSSTIANPDASIYDGVYESFSNKGKASTAAIMYVDIVGYETFTLYIRSYAESNYDYVMVSLLDLTINNNTTYSNTALVKAYTRGKLTSTTSISGYTEVTFTGIDEGSHRITIVYRKDSSANSGLDCGYVIIPKNQ